MELCYTCIMDEDKVKEIKDIYSDYNYKISNIKEKKNEVLKTYRTRIEHTRIDEIKSFLQKIFT